MSHQVWLSLSADNTQTAYCTDENRQITACSTVRKDQLKFNYCTVDIIDFEYCFIWHFQITAKVRSLEVEIFDLLLVPTIWKMSPKSNFVTNITMSLILFRLPTDFSEFHLWFWTSDFRLFFGDFAILRPFFYIEITVLVVSEEKRVIGAILTYFTLSKDWTK